MYRIFRIKNTLKLIEKGKFSYSSLLFFMYFLEVSKQKAIAPFLRESFKVSALCLPKLMENKVESGLVVADGSGALWFCPPDRS